MAFKKYSAKKDPDSTSIYGRTWPDWLGEFEEITNSVWLISISSGKEDSITLVEGSGGSSISVDKKSTSIWLEGGTHGIVYNLTNRITTSEGRVEDRTGLITVEEK